MAKVMSKYEKAVKLFNIIENESPSYAELVNAFKKIILSDVSNFDDINGKSGVIVYVGNNRKGKFFQFMKMFFNAPVVGVDFWGEEPQLTIRSHDLYNGGTMTINLTAVDKLNTETKETSHGIIHNIEFYYAPNKVFYRIELHTV